MYNLIFTLLLIISTHLVGAEINFFHGDDNSLVVTIHTERLFLRSVQDSDYEDYLKLFSDEVAMEKYADGGVFCPLETWFMVEFIWAGRWESNDPYSAFAVFHQETGEFLGNVTLGYGSNSGESSLSYIFLREHWGKGYATEAVNAVVKEYAPRTLEEGYLMDDVPLNKITTTVRVDNPASERILKNLGMSKVGEEEVYGSLHFRYSIGLTELKN